jgi:hypothetical protein
VSFFIAGGTSKLLFHGYADSKVKFSGSRRHGGGEEV